QYLTVCKANGIKPESLPLLGTRLGVSQEYFTQAHRCLLEIGLKLAHVLWRKLLPDERERADWSFNEQMYELLTMERFGLAVLLGTFAKEDFKIWKEDQVRRYMLINLAQAYKWGGKADKCKETIGQEDWSSCSNHIRMAIALLNDDYDKASEYMKRE